jgi:hypothetical protein
VYHIELRHFPHTAWSYNLSEPQLRAIVEPWCQERWIELGERKWNPHEAELTIFEGPELPVDQLSMGRGWRAAQRHGENVTDRVLAAARANLASAARAAAPVAAPAAATGDPSAPELLALLGDEPQALLEAWRHASALYRNRSPSERLALAEAALDSSGEG